MHDDRLVDFYTPLAIIAISLLILLITDALLPQSWGQAFDRRLRQFLIYISAVIIGTQIAARLRGFQLGSLRQILLKSAAIAVAAMVFYSLPSLFFWLPVWGVVQLGVCFFLLRLLYRQDESEATWCTGAILIVSILLSILQAAYAGTLMPWLHQLRMFFHFN